MNYKILAASAALSAGVIAFGLYEAQTPQRRTTERLSTLEVAAPAMASFAANRADYPPAPTEPPPPVAPGSAQAAVADMAEIGAMPAIPVGMPQIAYVYAFGYRIAGPKIPALQQRHADLCESKGPQVCRIMGMNQSGDEGDYAHGSLQLAVASPQARAFGKELGTLAEDAEGEQVSATISGEDLSKAIVDTEARLRARTVLRDRLMDVLATRRGTVAELVEAERGVARVNEEIDQARSWLREMEGRVAYSRIDLTYAAGAPAKGGFVEPVRGAIGSLGAIFGTMIAVLIVLGAIGAPLVLGALGARRLRRRLFQAPAEAEA